MSWMHFPLLKSREDKFIQVRAFRMQLGYKAQRLLFRGEAWKIVNSIGTEQNTSWQRKLTLKHPENISKEFRFPTFSAFARA